MNVVYRKNRNICELLKRISNIGIFSAINISEFCENRLGLNPDQINNQKIKNLAQMTNHYENAIMTYITDDLKCPDFYKFNMYGLTAAINKAKNAEFEREQLIKYQKYMDRRVKFLSEEMAKHGIDLYEYYSGNKCNFFIRGNRGWRNIQRIIMIVKDHHFLMENTRFQAILFYEYHHTYRSAKRKALETFKSDNDDDKLRVKSILERMSKYSLRHKDYYCLYPDYIEPCNVCEELDDDCQCKMCIECDERFNSTNSCRCGKNNPYDEGRYDAKSIIRHAYEKIYPELQKYWEFYEGSSYKGLNTF
jgi:hypothetical protein